MEVKATDTRLIGKNGLLASVWIAINESNGPDSIGTRILLLQQKTDNGMFISLPTDAYIDSDGQKRYRKLVVLSDELYERVKNVCIAAYKAELNKNQATASRPIAVPPMEDRPVETRMPSNSEPSKLVDEILGDVPTSNPQETPPTDEIDEIDALLEQDLEDM